MQEEFMKSAGYQQNILSFEIIRRAESSGILRGDNKTAFKDASNPILAKRRAGAPPSILVAYLINFKTVEKILKSPAKTGSLTV